MSISNTRSIISAPIIYLIICLVGLVCSALLESRAYFLGFVISFWGLLICNFREIKSKIFYSGLLFIIIVSAISFVLKLDSSLGRVLIYKISFNILTDNLFTGVGSGEFKRVYLLYQARYFAQGEYSVKELLLADNTTYVFNDYLQIVIEWGLAGWFIVIGYFYLLVKIIQNGMKSYAFQEFLYSTCFVTVITLSVAALFTPVYYKFPCLLLFLIALSWLFWHTYKAYLPPVLKYCLILTVLIGLLFTDGSQHMFKYRKYQVFDNSIDLAKSGFKTEALTGLKSIYSDLEHDGYYLSIYGRQLANAGQIADAIPILRQSLNEVSNSENYLALADCYFALQQYSNAETNYLKAISMVPNRFRPRFNLFNLYKQTGQINKEKLTGREILALPIKIPSPFINFIKLSVKHDLAHEQK
ncbi:O-antigen ligase family protein [Mucilaginibacter rigui]|uniref:O-antigen ligase family protein n=1 Tax=Mucilaginibacter rigui TaxID=534635 RepID=A0ABR7X905_9SPHI|nr:O-antigen ligase family protein [Mucilaginibacter rigui]MBD1387055.1 O-antigen ligase family protein [Mucilaginibacter rigui]